MTRKPAAAALGLLLAACTGGGSGVRSSPPPVRTGPGSAAAAMARLCTRPKRPSPSPVPKRSTPPEIARIEREVESVRGLRYRHPVSVDPVTHAELARDLLSETSIDLPANRLARRTRAWQTIGAIPKTTGIRGALRRYGSTQVIGFYDPANGRLEFIGTAHPTPLQHVALAHELTHALDDQYFHLERVNRIEDRCRDERLLAASGAIEGSAQLFSGLVAVRYLSSQQLSRVGNAGGSLPSGVPPFILNLQGWPYIAGLAFMKQRYESGGIAAVNEALRHLPVSTQQVIHPDAYPNDVPVSVDVPNVASELGAGWHDLDVMQVGEEWLDDLLGLRLDKLQADGATAGWRGGLYRAWTDGSRVAVVLSTVWDNTGDAAEFSDALGQWARPGQEVPVVVVVHKDTSQVLALFATDHGTLTKLELAEGVRG